MRTKIIIIVCFVIISIGAIYSCARFNKDKAKSEDSLSINYNAPLEIKVNSISYERNGLYLNGKKYEANGISFYSRLHDGNTIYSLEEIPPPFILMKKKNNDTLQLIKNGQRFYLNVTEEIEWSRRKYD